MRNGLHGDGRDERVKVEGFFKTESVYELE